MNTIIKEQFENILDLYLLEKVNTFSRNKLANSIRSFGSNFKDSIQLPDNYLTKGSAGQGNWAEVPWICIFDKEISISAQRGYYIVYLFDSNMQRIYLSLNQGWTQYTERNPLKTAQEEIKNVATTLQGLIRSTLKDFSFDSINLNSKKILAQGYELGHICGKFYNKGEIPNDAIIIQDLWKLIGVYRELKALIGSDVAFIKNLVPPELQEKTIISIAQRFEKAQSDEELDIELKKLEEECSNLTPHKAIHTIRAIERNERLADLIKKRANYKCEICGFPGFEMKNGERYAEAHHKEPLSRLGKNIPSNMFCVCPTCHRILHYGSLSAYEMRRMMWYGSSL